ncbi:hypothetical protein CEB3_c48080 [Peptococcaceae bacterium CEB3]|nr:hypothetical protein CEB3_c48080 [Peptococcaceae bacterium CEB3]
MDTQKAAKGIRELGNLGTRYPRRHPGYRVIWLPMLTESPPVTCPLAAALP